MFVHVLPLRRTSALALALVAALVPAGASAANDAPPPVEQAIPTVTISPATMAEVQARVPLSGTLVARQQVQVYPQVAGAEIVALNVEAGDQVKAGQELARLNDATLRGQLAQAEAEYQRAVAGVSQARSQIASTEATLNQSATALDRARALRRGGNASQAALDQAVAAEAGARSSADSARDGIAVAEAVQAQAQAARDIAQLNVDRTIIRSPVDGVVTARAAEIGALSASGGDPMFTLIANGAVEMRGEVIETALLELRADQPAELDVAGVGRITGEVRLLPAAVNPTTRLGEVRIALPADDRLRTGLFASGSVITARRDAVTVPATAVLSGPEGDHVQVVKDGVVETRSVRGGLLWEERREIADGLQSGETVITRAGGFFRTGDKVVIADENAPAAAEHVAAAPTDAAPATNEAAPAAAAQPPAEGAAAPAEPAAPAAQAAPAAAAPTAGTPAPQAEVPATSGSAP